MGNFQKIMGGEGGDSDSRQTMVWQNATGFGLHLRNIIIHLQMPKVFYTFNELKSKISILFSFLSKYWKLENKP